MIRQVTASAPVWAAARTILKKKSADLFGYIDKALISLSLDDIHDLRVSSRRLREAVSLFEDIYPSKRLRKIEKAAKLVTRLLGDLRNIDELMVFLKEIEKKLDEKDKREFARLYIQFRRRRVKAVMSMEKGLEKLTEDTRRESFLRAIETNRLKGNGQSGADPHQKLSVYAAAVMEPRAAKVMNLIEPALHEPDFTAQHKLRIAVKHFRYRTEMLAPVIGRGHEKLVASLKAYQTVLGSMHDMDVFREMLEKEKLTKPLKERLTVLIKDRCDRLFKDFKTMFGRESLENVVARVRHALAK